MIRGLNSRQSRILDVLLSAGGPRTVAEVSAALGEPGYQKVEQNRGAMRLMVLAGILTKTGEYNKVYAVAPDAAARLGTLASAGDETQRVVFDVPAQGFAGITDPDVAIEVEAEKVWTLAGVIRAANTAWGTDMGMDTDVREARALMAEARRQVRDDAPIGDHYRDGKFDGSAA